MKDLQYEDIYTHLSEIARITLLNFLEGCFLKGIFKKLCMVENKREELLFHLFAAVFAIKQRMNPIVEVQPIFIVLHSEFSSNFGGYFDVWIRKNAQAVKIQPYALNKVFKQSFAPETAEERQERKVVDASSPTVQNQNTSDYKGGTFLNFVRDDLSEDLDRQILGLPDLE